MQLSPRPLAPELYENAYECTLETDGKCIFCACQAFFQNTSKYQDSTWKRTLPRPRVCKQLKALPFLPRHFRLYRLPLSTTGALSHFESMLGAPLVFCFILFLSTHISFLMIPSILYICGPKYQKSNLNIACSLHWYHPSSVLLLN